MSPRIMVIARVTLLNRVMPLAAVGVLAGGGWRGELLAQHSEDRIRRVERGLRAFEMEGEMPRPTGGPLTLDERMRHYNVPGVSVAVIDGFDIAWARGYGVRRVGDPAPVTPDTRFQAASIGKPLTAAAALSLVERDVLDLDEDVNVRLVSWKVPPTRFTQEQKVTLRRLLSHSAGVGVHGFRGYDRGDDLPTLRQILDGAGPANNDPIRVVMVPGEQWRYSGGGYMIVQQLLEDVAGRAFPEIMQEAVLRPTGMISSLYATPLPDSLVALAATAHDESGRPAPGGWHELACMGAGGGLWTTPSDLARFAIAIMRAYSSVGSGSSEFLSSESARLMLTPQIDAFASFKMGLGFLVEGEGRELSVMHGGENQPGFLSLLVAMPETGQGVVVMTNAVNGQALAAEILFAVEDEYGWPGAADRRAEAPVSHPGPPAREGPSAATRSVFGLQGTAGGG